jgi:hypothetical protein
VVENYSVCKIIENYTFLLWDGLGFFGFDDNKLDRLKGIPSKWYDRFKNKRWIIYNFLAVIVVVGIITNHLKELGKVKSQTISHEHEAKYRYSAAEKLKLASTYWFNLKDVVERVTKETGNSIPKDYSKFTIDHKLVVQNYLCTNIKF